MWLSVNEKKTECLAGKGGGREKWKGRISEEEEEEESSERGRRKNIMAKSLNFARQNADSNKPSIYTCT